MMQLAQAFLDEVPARMERLRQAFQAADAATVQASAHSLKGTLAVFAAKAAITAAARLEELVSKGDLSEANAPLTALEGEVQTLLAELKTFVQSSP
jgi:HPt (histidine-containing phosphotransfer) domain-containing protein